MKISTDNSVLINMFGHEGAMRHIAAAGFEGVDYSFYGIKNELNLLRLPDCERRKRAGELKMLAEELGLEFPQTHAELCYRLGSIGRDVSDPMYRNVVNSMETAALMGAKQIVIHTMRCPLEMPADEVLRLNVDFMRSFVPYAHEFGIKVGVENLFTRIPGTDCYKGRENTAELMNKFLDALGSDVFVSCCDLGHATITESDPAEFILGMSPERLTMLHVQDTVMGVDGHNLPYLGGHNWDKITEAIAKSGFNGWMNFEILHFYERFPKELVPDALVLAAKTARYLADKVESCRKILN